MVDHIAQTQIRGADELRHLLAGRRLVVEDSVMRTNEGKGMLWYTREKIGNATIHVVYKMSNEQG